MISIGKILGSMGMTRTAVRFVSALGMTAAVIAGVTVPALAAPARPAAQLPHTGASAYTAQTPNRILDTRSTGQRLTGGTLNLTVAGGSTTVPASAAAVVLNVTVTGTVGAGFLTVWPAGVSRPTASNLNWAAGETRPNLVVVPVGSGGQVSIYANSPADVVVDEEGYYGTPNGNAGGYVAVSPARLLDTRASAQTMSSGSTIDLQVTGAGGVPAAGVSGVVLNATVTNTSASGYLTAYPTGGTRPTASNLNWVPGWTVPNRITVPVGTGGKVTFFNFAGSTDLVVDVNGYYTDSTLSGGALFTAQTPVRVIDTRLQGGALGPNSSSTYQVSGFAGVPATGASAVVFNTTVTNTTASSFLTVYPNARPTASDLNWVAGQTIPNLVVATLSSSGTVSFYNLSGSTDLVVDLFGFFGGGGAGLTITANPSSLPADGSASTVTATVTKADGTAAINDPVLFSKSGAACGAFVGTNPTTTNGQGQATIQYTSGSTAGSCTVSATDSQNSFTGSVTITQTAVQNTVAVTPASANVRANGSTQGFSAKVTRKVGSANVVGDTVAFTVSGSACGSVSPTSGTTDSTGSVTTTYTSSTTVGFCTLTATDTSSTPSTFASGGSGTASITQTAGVAGNGTTIAPATPTVPADGATQLTLTVSVTGTANFNDPVLITTSGGASCGTVSPTTGATDGTGKFTTTYTASAVGGSCTVTATEANGGTSGTSVITQTPQTNKVTVTAVPNPIAGNGTSTTTITATVTRSVGGAAVVGDTVAFALGVGGACTGAALGTPSNAGKTDANGKVTVTYTSSVGTGFCPVMATDTALAAGDAGKYAVGGNGSVTVVQTAGSAATAISVVASPSSIPADAATGSAVTATVTTSGGAGVPNDTVSFTVSGSSCGSNTSVTKTTDANGKAAYAYTAAGTAGTCTVTAIEASAGLSNSATVTQTPVKNVVAVTPTSANVRANGSAQGFSANVKRQVGAANVAGDTVAFTVSGGAACGSVSPASGTTDSSGNVATTYTASTTVGFCTLTATDTSSTPTQFASGGTGSASITQTAGVVGNTTAVTAGTNPVAADNVSTSTLTVQVAGTANFNDPVMITTGGGDSCGTVSPTSGVTDGTGKFTASYTASAVGGACVVTATEANGGSSGPVTINQTPQKNNVALTASPNPIPGNGTSTSTFTATVTRAVGGAAVVGETVAFALGSQAACTGATLGTPSNAGKTDANGQVTVTYTSSTTSGFCTVTATDTVLATGDAGKYAVGGTNTFTITQS